MSYGLGDVPGQAGSPPVRTRFPSGPNAGQLADRYATYADIPTLLKPFAQQLGGAGYWYAPPPNPLDTLEDQASTTYDAASGAVYNAVNTTSDAILGIGGDTLKTVALVGGLGLAAYAFLSRRRG